MNTHKSIEEQLRKEYRKKTLEMAQEVSKSGTYEKVEGMIADWWIEKMHLFAQQQVQEAHEKGFRLGWKDGYEEALEAELSKLAKWVDGMKGHYEPAYGEANQAIVEILDVVRNNILLDLATLQSKRLEDKKEDGKFNPTNTHKSIVFDKKQKLSGANKYGDYQFGANCCIGCKVDMPLNAKDMWCDGCKNYQNIKH